MFRIKANFIDYYVYNRNVKLMPILRQRYRRKTQDSQVTKARNKSVGKDKLSEGRGKKEIHKQKKASRRDV